MCSISSVVVPDRHCSTDDVIFMSARQNIPVKLPHNFKSIFASSINEL